MTTHSLAILDDYQSASLEWTKWEKLSIEVTRCTEFIQVQDLAHTLQKFTIIHAMRERTKFPRELLEKLPNLRLLTTTGMKNRGIDMVAARELGIIVVGTTSQGDASSGTVEQTWALILALTRRLTLEESFVRSGKGWQSGVNTGLLGKTIGLLGVGRLGSRVAVIAKAFGMKVIAWSPNLTEERATEAGVTLAGSLEELLKTSDVVSIHMVLSPLTHHMIGSTEIACLKPTAFMVNTSRGPLVDEKALIIALQGRKFAGAGLDVFDLEPLPSKHPFLTMENVVLSPHMGYVEDTNYSSWWPQTIENIESFLAGKPVRILNG